MARAEVAVSVPPPGPPRPILAGGLAESTEPLRNLPHLHPVPIGVGTLLHGPFAKTPDTAEHLAWLRTACQPDPETRAPSDVLQSVLTLTAQLAQGQDLLLIGPSEVTRNVRAALTGYLKLHHQQVPILLWTHTPEEVVTLSRQGTVRATLLVRPFRRCSTLARTSARRCCSPSGPILPAPRPCHPCS